MSDTPRTDAHNWHDGDYDDPLHAFADFAKQLERELNAANSEIERLRKANLQLREGAEEQKQRIKRLEEMYEGVIGEKPELLGSNVMGLLKRELNFAQKRIKRLEEENNELRSEEARLLNTKGELERRIKRLEEAGDKMEPWSERVGQEFWIKAKEAKP